MSKNGVALILFICSFLGITVLESQGVDFIGAVTTAASFVLMVWNQAQRPDVSGFLFKK